MHSYFMVFKVEVLGMLDLVISLCCVFQWPVVNLQQNCVTTQQKKTGMPLYGIKLFFFRPASQLNVMKAIFCSLVKDNLGKIIDFFNCCATLKESCTSLIYGINPKYCVLNNEQFFLIKHFNVKQARKNPHIAKMRAKRNRCLKTAGRGLRAILLEIPWGIQT